MNKKGLSHVDWVMSMGIFLVYVLFMIIMIKPGSGPVYQGESLLDLVEFHFREAFEAHIEKIPLFVSSFSGCQFSISLPDAIGNYKSLSNDPNNLNQLPYSIGNNLIIENGGTYWLIHSNEINFIDNKGGFDSTLGCNAPLPSYSFGGGEIYEGFSASNVLNFFNNEISNCENNYETLKGQMNYPPDSEFQFFIYDATKTPPELFRGGNLQSSYNCIEPGQQDNVYVREFGTVILNEDLTVKPIIINLRVW